MSIQFELSPQAEARLAVEASAHGLAPGKYAGHLLQAALGPATEVSGELTVEQFHAMLNAMAASSEKLPAVLTESFSRESFYEDRA